jgi:hypothetical protein
MGTHSYYFSCFNPTGRYRLNLNKYIERELAKIFLLLNKKVNNLIISKKIFDRSQLGN